MINSTDPKYTQEWSNWQGFYHLSNAQIIVFPFVSVEALRQNSVP